MYELVTGEAGGPSPQPSLNRFYFSLHFALSLDFGPVEASKVKFQHCISQLEFVRFFTQSGHVLCVLYGYLQKNYMFLQYIIHLHTSPHQLTYILYYTTIPFSLHPTRYSPPSAIRGGVATVKCRSFPDV
jgi:hypothetical protein